MPQITRDSHCEGNVQVGDTPVTVQQEILSIEVFIAVETLVVRDPERIALTQLIVHGPTYVTLTENWKFRTMDLCAAWSDPDDISGWGLSPRDAGFLCGTDIARIFTHNNGIDLIPASHQLAMEGYKRAFDRTFRTRQITVIDAGTSRASTTLTSTWHKNTKSLATPPWFTLTTPPSIRKSNASIRICGLSPPNDHLQTSFCKSGLFLATSYTIAVLFSSINFSFSFFTRAALQALRKYARSNTVTKTSQTMTGNERNGNINGPRVSFFRIPPTGLRTSMQSRARGIG
ncbi:hypothetical protein BKA70DRAFT_1480051 [Coprinopsis sp. MPI-PUGE-AT-0042]|nr:hypothetical protein BKA70DRAFT_1480051 [Coprinopsis sp. MPI-PUGE-AT-0042]